MDWFKPAQAPLENEPPDDPLPPAYAVVPTQQLPTVKPRVEGRAVIVYEQEPRRRWGLVVFTGLMVALTAGVVLGQTSAYQPPARASVQPVAEVPVQPVVPSPLAAPLPASAPRGEAKTGRLEVTGSAESVQVRSVDLGDLLYSVPAAGAFTPSVQDTPEGPRIDLPLAGPGPVEILVHASVKWTIRLSGTANRHDVDLRAGGLAGLELAGNATGALLELPAPAGRTVVRVPGVIGELRVGAGGGPVRLRLAAGADDVSFAGRTRQDARAGTSLQTAGWTSAQKRYDIEASARLGTVAVEK